MQSLKKLIAKPNIKTKTGRKCNQWLSQLGVITTIKASNEELTCLVLTTKTSRALQLKIQLPL